jgi:hypothetical protein
MKHHFKHICYDIDQLTSGTKRLSQFMTRLRAQANSSPDMHDPDKYFGDGFEALIEVLIIEMGTSPYIQIKGYSPITELDMGVDGIGYGPNGEAHTVQIKARSNTQSVLTANEDHISNFVAHSFTKYNAQNLTLFTTAKGLHEDVSNNMYMSKVNTIGYAALTKLIDNNLMFWDTFRDHLIKH